jgi:hypothetical protein
MSLSHFAQEIRVSCPATTAAGVTYWAQAVAFPSPKSESHPSPLSLLPSSPHRPRIRRHQPGVTDLIKDNYLIKVDGTGSIVQIKK